MLEGTISCTWPQPLLHSFCPTETQRDGEQHLQPTLEGGQRNVSEVSGTGTTHQLAW